jgi:xanthine dehydrogenase/oxidase
MLEAIPVFMDNVYKIPNWDIKAKVARTNLPACTWMRGPGEKRPTIYS